MRGLELHEWVFELEVWRRRMGLEGGVANANTAIVEEVQTNVGAVVMGRNMFGGGRGPWPEQVGELRLEQIRAVEAPRVTHIRYRVLR